MLGIHYIISVDVCFPVFTLLVCGLTHKTMGAVVLMHVIVCVLGLKWFLFSIILMTVHYFTWYTSYIITNLVLFASLNIFKADCNQFWWTITFSARLISGETLLTGSVYCRVSQFLQVQFLWLFLQYSFTYWAYYSGHKNAPAGDLIIHFCVNKACRTH